jgi:hypothetical protein
MHSPKLAFACFAVHADLCNKKKEENRHIKQNGKDDNFALFFRKAIDIIYRNEAI